MTDNTHEPCPPVVMLGLDACEFTLIEQYMQQGKLPNLARLHTSGYCGRLLTQPEPFLSTVWTTAITGTNLGQHGWYFNKQWRHDRQRIEKTHPEWLPIHPFWEELDDRYSLALFDVPYATNIPQGNRQLSIAGWQVHDDFGKHIKPDWLAKELHTHFGKSPMKAEIFGPQSAETLMETRKEMLESTAQFADIVAKLLSDHPTDLLFAVLGSIHRGTHYLWDTSQIETSSVDPQTLRTLESALEEGYVAMDQAVGKIIDAIPENARVITFSLHGMGPNTGWFEYLPRMVERVHSGSTEQTEVKKGLVYRLKQSIPWQWVRAITRHLPASLNDALIPLWSSRMYDWSTTRYFTLPMDYNGYVRLNIRGRDAKGCLDPADISSEIETLERGLMSFRQLETGKPIVRAVKRIEELVGENAPSRDHLPDLVVSWEADFPASECAGLVTDIYGEIRWQPGHPFASGRSGNHTPNGWFVATGPDIKPFRNDESHSTESIVPTVLQWIGAEPSPTCQGKVIESLRKRYPLRGCKRQ